MLSASEAKPPAGVRRRSDAAADRACVGLSKAKPWAGMRRRSDAAPCASLRVPCGARVARAAAELALAWPARCCAARLCSVLEQSSPTRRLTAPRNPRHPALLGAAYVAADAHPPAALPT